MNMSDQLAEAFNAQITMELESSVAYLQLSAFCETQNLVGMASWMRHQSEEERDHAYQFLDFALDRGIDIRIGTIEAPDFELSSVEQAFQTSLEQERKVTAAIHDLYRLATQEGDLASFPILQHFIEEQNEEEASVGTILERIRLTGGESSGLLLLDSELGQRTGE